MCTGFEWLLAAGSLAGTVASVAGAKAPAPPPVPAAAPVSARAPGATVRIGSGQDEGKNTDSTAPKQPSAYQTRASGKSLSVLGKSGLAI